MNRTIGSAWILVAIASCGLEVSEAESEPEPEARTDVTTNDGSIDAGPLSLRDSSNVEDGTTEPTDSGALSDATEAGTDDSGPMLWFDAGSDSASDATADSGAAQIVWGIPVTGQSLAVGTISTPLRTTTQYQNLKLGFQVVGASWVPTALVPCGEPLRDIGNSTYPYNVKGESSSTIMGDQLSALAWLRHGEDYVTYHGNFGMGGWAMKFIKKNGVSANAPNTPADYTLGYSFQAMLDEFSVAKPLVEATGRRLKVRASILTHGESDYASTTYKDELKQLAADQKAGLFGITGQPFTDPFHVIATQPSGGYPNFADDTLSVSAHAMWMASVEDPAIVLAGPKYQYGYATDRIHMFAPGYDHLGVKYAQVYDRLASGQTWTPLQPTAVTVSGAIVRVEMHVPVLPFSFDETLNPNQVTHIEWKNGRGFEVVDDSGKVTIVSVSKTGPTTVSITLGAPPGSGLRLRYAMTNDGLGRRGQVADADPFVGIDAKDHNIAFAQGSTVATLLDAMPEHGSRDVIVASSLPSGTLITGVSNDTLTLSAPWTGPTGNATANVRFDNRNYLVQFDLPVPWTP